MVLIRGGNVSIRVNYVTADLILNILYVLEMILEVRAFIKPVYFIKCELFKVYLHR